MKTALALISVILCICIFDVHAQIPQTMSYQGVLTDASGNPVPDGNVTLTFRLYDVVTGGTALWQETQQVAVSKGVFNAILGSSTTLNLRFDKPYWLGITVAQGTELTPRVALTAAPYSLNSHSTIVQPQPGQGLTIRNDRGDATHVFSATGQVQHTGKTTIKLADAVAEDTALVIYNSKGPALFAVRDDTASVALRLGKLSAREALARFPSAIGGYSERGKRCFWGVPRR